jgi:GNAT superfamily N-acetyltransferase
MISRDENQSPAMSIDGLPSASSPDLVLAEPTPTERLLIHQQNSVEWGGALSRDLYVSREEALAHGSELTRNGGLTKWVLVDKHLHPDARPLLCSAESFRKRVFIKRPDSDDVREEICHGIGSVFCFPEYRGHGYASKMMTMLGEKLKTWQSEEVGRPVAFSTLWSDIGKKFYAAHGWLPFSSTHVEFPPASAPSEDELPSDIKILKAGDLEPFINDDIALIKSTLQATNDGKTHVTILPDMAHIQWHRSREEYLTKTLFFNHTPTVRGACVGTPGNRVWALWTRAYYGKLDDPKAGNTLYFLRLVVEDEDRHHHHVVDGVNGDNLASNGASAHPKLQERAAQLKAILQIAQGEAREWKTHHVELWNPSPLVQRLIEETGLDHTRVQREKLSIPSVMWYGEGGNEEIMQGNVMWAKNEKYAWC